VGWSPVTTVGGYDAPPQAEQGAAGGDEAVPHLA
jgi:hypothetical protein